MTYDDDVKNQGAAKEKEKRSVMDAIKDYIPSEILPSKFFAPAAEES